MFIFLRLLLAHFIADFPLQLSSIYNFKLKHVWGSFVHSAIVVLVCVILNIPFLRTFDIWVVIFWIWLIHGLQDWGKVVYCEKIKKDNLWVFFLDQLLHIALISVVFLIPKLNFMTGPAGDSLILKLYNNNTLVICLMGYVFAGFGGVFINLYVKEAFLKLLEIKVPTGRKKYTGIAERVFIVMLIVPGGYWFTLIIPYLGLRVWLKKSRNKEFFIDLVMNVVIATLVGLIVEVAVLKVM